MAEYVLPSLPKGYTEAEASRILTEHGYPVSAETLRKHRRHGYISYRKIGGLIRYTEADLLDYVNRRVVACQGQGGAGAPEQTTSRSGATSSPGRGAAPAGMRAGTTQLLDTSGCEALGSRI